MNNRHNQLDVKLHAAALLALATLCSWTMAAEPATLESAYAPLLEPVNWQAPVDGPLAPAPAPGPALPILQPFGPDHTPLLDSGVSDEAITAPTGASAASAAQRGVRPYGGGHPRDWPWGCGGSPFRTGPGWCDTWDVGCRWDVAVDGIVMQRETTDLTALADLTDEDSTGGPQGDPTLEQFNFSPGGRVWMTSKVPYSSWQMHFGYEGIEEWNASVVYPKQPLTLPGGIPAFPSEQRSVDYRSSLHSAELNFVRMCSPVWRPYCGVRYLRFDDEINDSINQEAAPPLPGSPPDPAITTTDSLNLFDIENNLIGFQVGVRHDLWRPNRRMTIEGFANTGVYYNRVKFTNLMGQFTTQEFADDTSTTALNESRIDFSDVANNDVREYSEISYISEASISGVCRLNKCWALRAGYQALWITNIHLAEDAFLGTDLEGRSLFFHGWHAGVEHRR